MSRCKKKKSHQNKSYYVVNEKSKTKRPKPPGTPQRGSENVSDSTLDKREESNKEG